MNEGISGIGGNAGCMDGCFGGVVNLEPLESLGGDKLESETGGASQLLSEPAGTEKIFCPHCLTEVREGYEKVCFFCEEKI